MSFDRGDPAILVLRRACEVIGPSENPFRAIWNQWAAQGWSSGDKEPYLRAEAALKQALAELGESNVPEFARSRDVPRYLKAMNAAIRIALGGLT